MAKAAGRAAALIAFLAFLSGCGDAGSVLSLGDGHRVIAVVNGASLEDGPSIMRSGDRIYPDFAASAENDPDVTGLLAFALDGRGRAVGGRVLYVLAGAAQAEREGDFAAEIEVRSFGRGLPPFYVPEGMAIGPHTLVFEALGARGTLRRTEIPFFYIGDAQFAIRDMQAALPGLFGARLIPPGTSVLLEASLDFDRRLDPYLIWRSGRSVVSRGRLSEGAAGVLWEAPGQTAFHPVSLEVLPFPPPAAGRWPPGLSREIILPISAAERGAGFFFGADRGGRARNALADISGGLLSWHRFEGSLCDSAADRGGERALEPTGAVRWVSVGQNYGLSAGADDAFLLPPANFFNAGANAGGGVFLLHFWPLADGIIFSASFPAHFAGLDGAWIALSKSGGDLELRVGAAGVSAEVFLPLDGFEPRVPVPAAVAFGIQPRRIEASLALGENAHLTSLAVGADLSAVLTGEGSARLGGAAPAFWESAGDSGPAQERAVRAGASATAVWDEFAVLLSPSPFFRAGAPLAYFRE